MKHRLLKRAIVLLLTLTMLVTGSGAAVFAESLNENAAKDAATTEQASEAKEDAAQAGDAEAEEEAEEAESDQALTAEDWEAKLPGEVSTDAREAMAEIAESQTGSDVALYKAFANADSLEEGDAAFVMFVLEYANVLGVSKAIGDDSKGTVKSGDLNIPVDADSEAWVKALDKSDLYSKTSDDSMPEKGDIVFVKGKAAIVSSADKDQYELIGAADIDSVGKYTVNVEKIDGFVSIGAIAPDPAADEETAEETKAEKEETADKDENAEDVENAEEELTEEELAAKKAEEEAAAKAEAEAAAIEADKKAQAEEEAEKAEEAARRIKAEKLVDKQIGAELTSAPGFGSKLKSIFTSDKGTEITLNGYLPEDATVRAYPVKVEIPGQNVLAAYDITIYVKDKDGKDVEWQPAEPLNVSIKTNKLAEAAEKADANSSFNVFHMETKDAYPVMVENIDLGDGEASFKADHFSIYVIGEEDTSKHVIYNFWWDESDITDNTKQPYKSIALSDGDSLLAPADPMNAARGAFEGWFTKRSGPENEFYCDQEPEASIDEDAAEDTVYDIYAKFDGAQYATFQSLYIDMKRTVFHTAKLTPTGDTYSLDLSTVPTYGAPVGFKFLGWSLTQPTDTHGYGENIPKTGAGRYYRPNETITGLTGSITLYPVVKKMHTVSLDGNGGTVKGLPVYKIQVSADDNLKQVIEAIPGTEIKRAGHTRDGEWFDAADGDNSVDLYSVVLSEDKTYYVHWTASTTKVTVKYWKEAVDKSQPYALIDEDTINVPTGSTVELGKKTGNNVSNTDVLFYNPGSSEPDQSLDINTVVSRVQTGGSKLGSGGGNYKKDTDLKYFFIDFISSADPEGNVHTCSTKPGNVRSFTVADDESTIVNVWICRTEYKLRFQFQVDAMLSGAYVDYDTILLHESVHEISDWHTIRLGESLDGIWPDVTTKSAETPRGKFGYRVVALGERLSGNKYPEAVSEIFNTPLSSVTSKLLEQADSSKEIELWGQYDSIFVKRMTTAEITLKFEKVGGGYTTRTVKYNYIPDSGDRYKSNEVPGYTVDVGTTTTDNGGSSYVTDNEDGTVSIKYRNTETPKATVTYYLNKYTVNLIHDGTTLVSDSNIKYTQPIKDYLDNKASEEVKTVFDNPTAAAGMPPYMVWDGVWYTDTDFDIRYKLDAQTMPASNANIFAKFSPIPVSVIVDNGIEDGNQTVKDPQLNLAGSEMGGSIRYLDYQHEHGTTKNYVAHEHTIAEFIPTHWVNPVWENHVFTGWKVCEKGDDGKWDTADDVINNLVDINIPVDKDIKLVATWQDMTRHSIHYFEGDKEVYLDPEAYVEGKTVVIKGTTTEIYENNTTSVFQYWKDSDGTIYKPGQEITMGDKDITLEAVFDPGGTNSGSEKATYTFKVENDGNWEDYYEEIVYRGERLSPPPKAPTHGTDVFEGWYLDRNLTQRFDGFGTVSAPVNTTLYASFKRPWRVTYRGYAADGEGELITVQTYPYTGTDNLNTMGVGQYYTYQTDSALYALVGWSDIKVTPGSTPDDDHYFSGYTDHKVNGDMTLYPVLEDGFWLTYYHDENMVTIPDVYYGHSQNLNFKWPDPDDVKRTDYDFTGKWYTDPECQTEFNWNSTLDHDTTIYAGWKPKPEMKSQYTVVWWVEKADSNGTLNDKSNYVYSNSVTVKDIPLGEVFSNTDNVTSSHGTYQAKDAHHADQLHETKSGESESTYVGDYFVLNSELSDASTTVERDGNATLNIYLQRKRYTVNFVLNGNGTIRYNNTNYTTNWSQPGWYQMPWGGKWPILNGDEEQGYGNTMPKLTMGDGKTYDNWQASVGTSAKTVPVMLEKDNLPTTGTTLTYTLTTATPAANTYYAYYKFRDKGGSYSDKDYRGINYDQTFNTSVSLNPKQFIGYDYDSNTAEEPVKEFKYNYSGNYAPYYTVSGNRHYFTTRPGTGSNVLDILDENGNPYNGNATITYYYPTNSGWYRDTVSANNVRSGNSNYVSTVNSKYTFYYTRQEKKIHLYDADGNEISQSPITLMVGESLTGKISDPSVYGINPPEEGKVFAGWSRSKDSLVDVYNSNDTTATMPLYDIHYYLHWADKMVTVTVVDEDGNTIQEYGPMVYDTKLSEFGLQDNPPDNHKFTGWQIYETEEDISLSTKIKDNIKVKGNYVDLRAKSLYYDLNGGKLKDTEEDTEEDPLIPGTTLETSGTHKDQYVDNDHYMVGASVPVKNIQASKLKFLEGYMDFAYWNTEKDGSGDIYYPNDAIEIPNGKDMVLYAIYSPDLTTTLEYDLNYEGQPAKKSVLFRDYRSTQYLEDGELKVNDDYTVGTEFVSGEYKALSYGEGTGAKTVEVMRPGYIFRGWAKSKTATEPEYTNNSTKIRVTSYDDNNHHIDKQTLYAVWEEVQLPVEVYEITNNGYPGTEKTVTGENKAYLLGDDIPAIGSSAQTDIAVAEAYDAYTRNDISDDDAYGKAMLSKADANFATDPAITFIRLNYESDSNNWKWQYTTEATAPSDDESWKDFGTDKLRLYYYPNPRDVNVYFVAEEEDGTLTTLNSKSEKEIGSVLFTISNTATTGETALKIEDSVTKSDKLYNLQHIAIGPEMTADTRASALTSLDSKAMYLKNKLEGVLYSIELESSDQKNPQAMPAAKPAVYIVYREKTISKLTVTKTVTGEYADRTKEFDFTISGLTTGKQYDFTKYEKGTNGQYAQMTGTGATGKATADSEGNITFKLKHNQKIELQMPVRTELTISEDKGDYTAKWAVGSGSQTTADSVKVTLSADSDQTVDCENDFDDSSIVPSGIEGSKSILIPIFAILILALGVVMSIVRRRRLASRWTR